MSCDLTYGVDLVEERGLGRGLGLHWALSGRGGTAGLWTRPRADGCAESRRCTGTKPNHGAGLQRHRAHSTGAPGEPASPPTPTAGVSIAPCRPSEMSQRAMPGASSKEGRTRIGMGTPRWESEGAQGSTTGEWGSSILQVPVCVCVRVCAWLHWSSQPAECCHCHLGPPLGPRQA